MRQLWRFTLLGVAASGCSSDAPDACVRHVPGTMCAVAGTGELAELSYVSRVQLDTDGGLLISDQTNSCIRKILPPM